MSPLFSDPVFQSYALCCCLLVFSLYGLGFWTAKIRNDCKMVVNHEDVKVNFGGKPADAEHPRVARIKRAHLNALENAVPFFIMGFLYSETHPSVGMARALFFAFVGIRLIHAFFYLTAPQHFRTLSFGVGALINLTMVVQVVRALM